MTHSPSNSPPADSGSPRPDGRVRPTWLAFLRLARPAQWSKSVFVLVGPLYGLQDMTRPWPEVVLRALAATAAFCLAASSCYVVNDILDAAADRLHPRKCRRPIASGAITPGRAAVFAGVLVAAALGLMFVLDPAARGWTALSIGVYVGTVWAYSLWLKHVVIADVICLSLGFVLRVIGGCAAVGIWPSSWLLNCTFFIAMFLSFGKRLGERRTVADAASIRAVQGVYTDELLRMTVVVTAVATLVTYSGYVQDHAERIGDAFNLLWVTMLPATYALLRCIVLLERGDYDDPTELAMHDRPFQLGAVLFAVLTLVVIGIESRAAAG